MNMRQKAKREIKNDEWRFVIAGIDILIHRGRIKSRSEIDDYGFSDVNSIEYYNEDEEYTGEVDLSTICQFLEIPDLFQ